MEPYYLDYRNHSSIDWIFKQLDHKCGLSFNSNFHFALAALLLKGEKRIYYYFFITFYFVIAFLTLLKEFGQYRRLSFLPLVCLSLAFYLSIFRLFFKENLK